MNKIFISINAFLFIVYSSFAQNVSIPDANFKAALLANKQINTNNDTEIQKDEATAFKGSMAVTFKGIKSLNGIEAFVNIISLECYENQLTSLDISKNTALTYLACGRNELTNLDLSKNVLITTLYCGANQLINLDFSKNTALTLVNCGNNQFLNLDFSKNTALGWLLCDRNPLLTKLNVKNGKNSKIDYFNVTSNPMLTCIQVDNSNSIPSSWKKDATAIYKTQCTVIAARDDFFASTIKLYPNPTSDDFSLSWEGEISTLSVELWNSQGALLRTQTLTNNAKIDVADLPKGLYLCQMKSENKILNVAKVVIE